jgi:TonB family protein
MALRLGAGVSLAIHTAALAALVVWAPTVRRAATVAVDLRPAPPGPDDVVLPGEPPQVPLGPADFLAERERSPRARVDVPDPRRARGDHPIGREDDEVLRAQAWNDPEDYRLLRAKTSDRRSSDGALARTPAPGLDASQRRRANLARAGDRAPVRRPLRLDHARGRPGAEVQGFLAARAARAFIAAGATAVETSQSDPFDEAARVRDDSTSAQASSERDPQPFDLGHAGGGTTRPDVEHGPGQPSSRARMQDAYFRALHARVLERVRWPRELAVALEQGEVVVTFTLRRDGSVAEVDVTRPSGHRALDEAVVAAIHEAAPFGEVPSRVLPIRSARELPELRVSAPFVFENPLIR